MLTFKMKYYEKVNKNFTVTDTGAFTSGMRR